MAVTKVFGDGDASVIALDSVSARVNTGKFVAIVGPSGSGKSTLLHLLAGMTTASDGKVLADGVDLTSMSDKERAEYRRRRLGFVFQAFELVSGLVAWENVAVPALLDGRSASRVRARALELLESVGMAARAGHRPDQLSGGEAQRVAIARALMAAPEVVLADEPTGNLDTATSNEVLDVLVSTTIGQGRSLVVVTHDGAVAARAHRTIEMVDGRVHESNTAGAAG